MYILVHAAKMQQMKKC